MKPPNDGRDDPTPQSIDETADALGRDCHRPGRVRPSSIVCVLISQRSGFAGDALVGRASFGRLEEIAFFDVGGLRVDCGFFVCHVGPP